MGTLLAVFAAAFLVDRFWRSKMNSYIENRDKIQGSMELEEEVLELEE